MVMTGPHILIYPFPSSGHIIPLLDLTHRLLNGGLSATVLLTPSNLPLLDSLIKTHRTSCLQHLVLPSPEFPNPKQNKLIATIYSMRKLHYPVILQWFQSHPSPPLAIISDFFLGWTFQLATQLHIPRLVFCPSGASALSLHFTLWRDLPENKEPQNPNRTISFPNIPNSPVYPWWQIPHHYTDGRKGDSDWDFFRENILADITSWGSVFNTFTELERAYLDHIKKEVDHDRVWAVGPVLPPEVDATEPNRGGFSTVPFQEVHKWLDGRQECSVVYVCFGSRTVLSANQMESLTTALESCRVQFILSVREPDPSHVGEGHGLVPKGFEDRTADRGLVIRGWAPQVAILRHRAVGAFLTHCGWNSVTEGLAAGVVMLTWPMGADQYTNAKLVVDQLGVGMRVAEGKEGGPDPNELGSKLLDSVYPGRPERVRAKELSAAAMSATKPGGSSDKQLDDLVKRLFKLRSVKEG